MTPTSSSDSAVPKKVAALAIGKLKSGAAPSASGSAVKTDGAQATTTVGVTFSLYKDQTGGAPLWQEVQNVTLRPGGRYTVLLGANSRECNPCHRSLHLNSKSDSRDLMPNRIMS